MDWLDLEKIEELAFDPDLKGGTGFCELGKGQRGISSWSMLGTGECKDIISTLRSFQSSREVTHGHEQLHHQA